MNLADLAQRPGSEEGIAKISIKHLRKLILPRPALQAVEWPSAGREFPQLQNACL